jgi:hypothetical protein
MFPHIAGNALLESLQSWQKVNETPRRRSHNDRKAVWEKIQI